MHEQIRSRWEIDLIVVRWHTFFINKTQHKVQTNSSLDYSARTIA